MEEALGFSFSGEIKIGGNYLGEAGVHTRLSGRLSTAQERSGGTRSHRRGGVARSDERNVT